MTEMEFLVAVKSEVLALRQHATNEQKSRLKPHSLSGNDSYRCVYGQLTGYCFSRESCELIEKCAKTFFKHLPEIKWQDCEKSNKQYVDDQLKKHLYKREIKEGHLYRRLDYMGDGVPYTALEFYLSIISEIQPYNKWKQLMKQIGCFILNESDDFEIEGYEQSLKVIVLNEEFNE